MSESDRVEFGVVHWKTPDVLHRGPMTGSEATAWLGGWVADGGRSDAFLMVSRIVGPWEVCRRAKALNSESKP